MRALLNRPIDKNAILSFHTIGKTPLQISVYIVGGNPSSRLPNPFSSPPLAKSEAAAIAHHRFFGTQFPTKSMTWISWAAASGFGGSSI